MNFDTPNLIPFSVLMSVYSKEHPAFLQQSLDSVFEQTLNPTEIIIVEDGPLNSDLYQTLDFYEKKHKNLKRIKLEKNQGLGKALNEGLNYCKFDLVIRMDTDDIAKPDRFEKQINYLIANPDISVCSTWLDEFVDDINHITSTKKLPTDHNEIYRYGKTRCPINHPAVAFRKKDVIISGGYGPFPEDYSLWGRMLVRGFKFHNIPESLLWFRTSKDVYHRRGGKKYLKAILKLNKELCDIGYISKSEYIGLFFIRTFVSLLPNSLRAFIYKKFLRSSI